MMPLIEFMNSNVHIFFFIQKRVTETADCDPMDKLAMTVRFYSNQLILLTETSTTMILKTINIIINPDHV